MKRKSIEEQEMFNKKWEEYVENFTNKHTPWIILKYGCTYVGYDIKDQITEDLMVDLRKLLELMGAKFSIKYPFGEDESYYFILEEEDKDRAEFIQKFFDNGYKLSW